MYNRLIPGEGSASCAIPIPEGARRVYPSWGNGQFVICDSLGNYWTWISILELTPNGILNGLEDQRYGRRQFGQTNFFAPTPFFSNKVYHEIILQEIVDMVLGNGGFYISSFPISREEDGIPRSIPDQFPWINVRCCEAMNLIPQMAGSGTMTRVPSGADFDTVAQSLIDSGALTYSEVTEDSSSWGNYYNSTGKMEGFFKTYCPQHPEFCVNGIWHFAGNQGCITTECFDSSSDCPYICYRGGSYKDNGSSFPATIRSFAHVNRPVYDFGLHAVMYVNLRK